MSKIPVLIAGAGPTGLVLALSLSRRGIPFRIVDDDAGPGPHSRALVVHARTLEFYDQLGFADGVLAEGIKLERGHLRESHDGRSREIISFGFGDLGDGISKYPFALAYAQDFHERFLVARLIEAGVEIEWNTSLTGFRQDSSAVAATLTRNDGVTESIEADYLCGCDGAHSIVRQTLDVPFSGGTYSQLYFVADVQLDAPFQPDLVVNLAKDVFTLLLPVRSSGMQRLIGLVPDEVSASGRDVRFEDLRDAQEVFINAKIRTVNWFSTYRVHHRVAEHFRDGRSFLLGDAGHLHSPAGGQGMNTGIGDAVNLAWKLAMVLKGSATEALLDTYESERIGFARTLVATTDRAFSAIVMGGLPGEIVRRMVLPLFFGIGTSTSVGRHAMFGLLSQTRIEYEKSALSEGHAGNVAAGDRLPWVADADNYAPLRSLQWQVHVYGAPASELERECEEHAVALHVFPWTAEAREKGLREGVMYLVRPDGYLALVKSDRVGRALRDYVETHGLQLAAT